MAIQFNLPNIAADNPLKSYVPDYIGSLKKGLELGYMPRHHENEEYKTELSNKINEGKAKYALQQALADLQNTQATTSHLGAQTRGLNIENRFLPEKLRLAEQIQRVKARYAEQREKNEIQQLMSGNKLTDQQARELGIKNETLADKLRIANQIEQFKANNPLLYTTGIPQQLGGLKYAMEHPELNGNAPTNANQPLNIEINHGSGKNAQTPLEMEVNYGRNAPIQNRGRIKESSIPSIGRRFLENEEPEVPYEQLSKSVARAFHAPNESKIPSIGRFFEEPNYSQLNNIPMLMSMMGNQRQAEVPQQQSPVEPMKPLEQQQPEKMNLADLVRQSIVGSLTGKGGKGTLSPIGRSIQERQNIEQGFYPGTNVPIQDPQKQAQMLQNYDDQIRTQSLGKNGSAKDSERIQLEKDKLRAQIEKEERLSKQANLSPAEKAEYEAVAKENVKQRFELQKNIPEAYHELDRVNKAIKLTKEHPNYFGPPSNLPFGARFSGPKGREQKINEKDYGVLKSTLENLVGPKAKELSGSNRVLATAFNLAGNIKPTLAENQQIALGKLYKIRHELLNSVNDATIDYKDVGGKRNYFVPKTTFIDTKDFDSYMAKLTPIQRQMVKNRIISKDRP